MLAAAVAAARARPAHGCAPALRPRRRHGLRARGDASPGTWIAAVDDLFFVGAGLAVLAWGPRGAQVAIGGGLAAAVAGTAFDARLEEPVSRVFA